MHCRIAAAVDDRCYAPKQVAMLSNVIKVAAVIVVVAACASAALGNGVTSERRAGGLVFKKSDTISIASEDLYLSFYENRVSYIYQSKAAAAQDVTISFPMPEVPVDDSPDSIVFNDDKIADVRNYMNFKVRVDGREVHARLSEVARLRGQDVTARLKPAGVPLIFSKGGPDAMQKLSRATADALVKDGLFERSDGDPPSYDPKWTYQVVFEWEQSFRPGATKVDISYKPITGDSVDYGDTYETGRGVQRYCVDAAFRSAVQRRKASGGGFDVYTLGYVLKTARFWSGPIGKFRLVVDKGKPANLVAFCPLNSRKISDTQFEWTATNFSPDRDIEVVFFYAVSN
jgi:hypothetical protein